MTDHSKPRVRLYVVGQATFRLVSRVRGWCGPYGQDWVGAKWACITCGKLVKGDNERPNVSVKSRGSYGVDPCANNGHAPCAYCGKQLPRTNDGCPRAHAWRDCPGKTEADRMVGQHAHAAHHERVKP